MFSLFGGFKAVKDIAKEIDVNHKVFGTALTEMGVNYAHIKIQEKALMEIYGENSARRYMAIILIPTALEGLLQLSQRFGHQNKILHATISLEIYYKNNLDILEIIQIDG